MRQLQWDLECEEFQLIEEGWFSLFFFLVLIFKFLIFYHG